MPNLLTPELLRRLTPDGAPWIIDGIIRYQDYLEAGGVLQPHRLAHFLAQIIYETDSLRRLEENLVYTSAARLRAVFPTHFKTDAAAAPFVRSPEALANRVYADANRSANYRLGNTQPGDGWKYRGSGLKQITGRANFTAFEEETGIGVVDRPEILREFPGAMHAAVIYWISRDLNEVTDREGDATAEVTKRVQGGAGGLADRQLWYARTALAMLGYALPARGAIPSATIKNFQTKAGFTGKDADGIMGPKTRGALASALRGLSCVEDDAPPPPAPEPTQEPWEAPMAALQAQVARLEASVLQLQENAPIHSIDLLTRKEPLE